MFLLSINIDKPRTIKEEIEMENKGSWRLAMDEEMDSLRKNDTWNLVIFYNDGDLFNRNECLKTILVQMEMLRITR